MRQSTLVQVIQIQGHVVTDAGVLIPYGTNGQFWLDNSAPYADPNAEKAIAKNEYRTLVSSDSPFTVIEGKKEAFRRDSFKTYLMYQPVVDGVTGIWVTLRSLRWRWSGLGTKGEHGKWTVIHSSSKNPESMEDYRFPEWDYVFVNQG